jgi:hypothetical protein
MPHCTLLDIAREEQAQMLAALQTTSEPHLPPWGMKPTGLDRRNVLDLHALTRTH